jgi:tetratricopeptide (TPR) repeat protein
MNEPVFIGQMQAVAAGGLNARLDELDVLVSKLGSERGKKVIEILYAMDAIDSYMQELRQAGSALQAEESQFETSCAILRKRPGDFLRALGGSAVLAEERRKRNPPKTAWWWYLDELQARQRRSGLKRVTITVVLSLVVLALLAVIYQRFFAPSPEVVARYEALNQSTNLAGEGKVAEAQAALQKGLALLPDDPDLLVMAGVLQQMQADQQAAATYARAKAKYANPEDFYLTRAEDLLSVGQNDLALADCQEIVGANPKSAIGFYLLGSVQEAQKNTGSALTSYQKAIDLADAQGLTNLVAEARVKMGYLLQAAGADLPTLPISPTP